MADIMLPYNGASRGELPNGTDLNNVTEAGIYGISSGLTYVNSPETLGLLEVFKHSPSGNYIYQKFVSGNDNRDNWFRFKQGSTYGWTDWQRIAVGNIIAPTYANGILDYALNVAPQGVSYVSPRNMGYADLPSEVNMYGTAIILRRSSNAISVTLISDSNMYETITNTYYSSAWHGWKYNTGSYMTSKTRWDAVVPVLEQHSGVVFSLNGTASSQIFGLSSSYNTCGLVAKNSDTVANGLFTHNDKQYTFEYNPSTSTLVSLRQMADSTSGIIQVASHNGANSTTAFTLTHNMTTSIYGSFQSGLLVLHKTNVGGTNQDGLYLITAYLRDSSTSAMSSNKAYVIPIISSGAATVAVAASTTAGEFTITITPTVTYMGAVLYKFCGGW